MVEVNKIQEIYKGHFQVILDFPTPNDLNKILDTSYKYVWGIEHNEKRTLWSQYSDTLFGVNLKDCPVLVRNMALEYLLPTEAFIDLIPTIKQKAKIIQTNEMPPYFLDLKKLEGKKKYDMLKNTIDYLFEIEIPGASDYAPIISPDVRFLEKVVKSFT